MNKKKRRQKKETGEAAMDKELRLKAEKLWGKWTKTVDSNEKQGIFQTEFHSI
jgi:hypothetical protein